MENQSIRLSVPAEPTYARSVRMMAANLAVVCGMGVEDVEDVRMLAEEGFVYSCASSPETCEITFEIAQGSIGIDYSIGQAPATTDELSYAELLLNAVCDEFEVDTAKNLLRLLKRAAS